MKLLEGVNEFILRYWRGILLGGLVSGLVLGLLLYQIGELTGGIGQPEAALYTSIKTDSISLRSIVLEPLYLPYQLGLYILQWFTPSYGAVRAVSAMFGLIGLIGTYFIIRTWFTRRLAIMGTVLFLCSSWFLHTARYASYDAIYLALPLVLAAWIWIRSGQYTNAAILIAVVGTAMGMYVPGFIWFVVAAAIWQRKPLLRTLKRTPQKIRIPAAFGAFALLVPLIWYLINPDGINSPLVRLANLTALPTDLSAVTSFGSNVVGLLQTIFISASGSSLLAVGNLPLLDIAMATLFLFGAFALASQYKLDRAKIVGSIIIVAIIMAGFGSSAGLSLLLPFVFIVIAEGLAYLLTEWFVVFPRNPVPRTLGLVLLSAVVVVSCAFQLASYFVAWPSTDAAKAHFIERP